MDCKLMGQPRHLGDHPGTLVRFPSPGGELLSACTDENEMLLHGQTQLLFIKASGGFPNDAVTPLPSCVPLGRLLRLPKLQFLHL